MRVVFILLGILSLVLYSGLGYFVSTPIREFLESFTHSFEAYKDIDPNMVAMGSIVVGAVLGVLRAITYFALAALYGRTSKLKERLDKRHHHHHRSSSSDISEE